MASYESKQLVIFSPSEEYIHKVLEVKGTLISHPTNIAISRGFLFTVLSDDKTVLLFSMY